MCRLGTYVLPLVNLWTGLWQWWYPNRAVDPVHEDICERAGPWVNPIWEPVERQENWLLQDLGVLPEYQGSGIGRELVKWGLDKAEQEGVSASVIAADGKDGFYQKLGYDEFICNICDGKDNPFQAVGRGGNCFFRFPTAQKDYTDTKS